MHKNVAIILALGLASVQLEAIDYTWTGNAGNGEWTDAGNWTGIGVPGASDNTTIGGGATVAVPGGPGNFSIGGLSLNGTLDIQRTGTITISGPVSISGTINSSGDASFQSDITLTGDSTLESDGDVELQEIGNADGASANSLTIRGIDITLEGIIGKDNPIGDLTLEADDINAMTHIWLDGNLTINTGTFTIPNNSEIKVGGSLAGTGSMEVMGGANITVGKDFTIANFTAGNSTVILDKNTTANLGAGNGYTFSNLIIDKRIEQSTSHGRVSAVSDMLITGNLFIIRGTLNGGAETIDVVGNMAVTAPGRFEAGSGTVKFIQSNSILETNGSAFNNLEVVDSNLDIRNSDFTAGGRVRIESENNPTQLRFIRGSHSATIANLLLEGEDAPVVDFTNWNFSIGSSLDNEDGEIRLTGEQTTQAFAYDDANKRRMGLVSYYNGNGAGTIRHGNFWNLKIDASGQSINLDSDIYIHGYYDPNFNKTLSTPVSESSLVGLQLRNGTLNTANHKISLHGSYIRTDSVVITGNLRLTLLGNYPSYIGGNNDFFEFICEDVSVRGKILYFQSGKTTRVVANARFAIRGSGENPPGGPLNPSSLVFPFPRSYVYVVSSQPESATHYWNFNRIQSAELELEFIYLLHSNASTNPQAKPVNVTLQDCPNWHSPPYITLSWTKDVGDLTGAAIHNGRIDKILVESDSDLNMNFSGLEVEIEGYEVEGFQAHEVNANQFYIELEEQAYLDTSATPRWKFIRNESLKDTTHGFELRLYDGGEEASKAKVYETPYDDAAPIIGYTLAIADKDEIFIHFSEPVVDLNSSSIAMDDFSVTAGGGLVSLRRVSDETHSGMRELILTTSSSISASDILDEVEIVAGVGLRDIPSSKSTHDFDLTDADDNAVGLVKTTHRISDVGLGLVGNGLMEPISARGSITPVSGSSDIVTSFAWKNFLPADDFSLIAHRYTGISENPRLIYSNSATAGVKNGRLWLPIFGENAALERNFSGLVPRPHTRTITKMATSSNNDNYTYQFEMPDAMIKDGRDLEFVFYFANSELYCAQVLDDTASNWYRQVLPWAIRIREVALQAGNVSILNNILNPIDNDKASIYYELSTAGVVTIQVFDLSGDTVAVLQRGFQNAGKYTVSWDGRNGTGNPVARGIYFVRLVGPDKMDQIRKILVVK